MAVDCKKRQLMKFKIETMDIDKIIPYETNPKIHPQDQINLIAESIKKFKFDQPIVIDEDFIIIKGHGRLLAAQLLKLKKVPVIIRTDMSEAEKIASRIADNKSNESDWNFEKLDSELQQLDEMNFDFDFGFDNEVDFDNIESNENREPSNNSKTIECPNCGQKIDI